MKIILGSSSTWRKGIMETIVPDGFEVMSPDIDEKAIRLPGPQALVTKLAMAKSEALQSRITESVVLVTSDQVVVCDDKILEKPESPEQAREYLERYRRLPASCVTAVYVVNTKSGWSGLIVDKASVWFRSELLTDKVIDHFIEDGLIFTAAGGFCAGHESFEPYVLRIQGEIESVMGLPKKLTTQLIADALEEV